jgi:ribosomal protein S27AE
MTTKRRAPGRRKCPRCGKWGYLDHHPERVIAATDCAMTRDKCAGYCATKRKHWGPR